METQIPHPTPDWYRTFFCGLYFYPWFHLDARPSIIFTLLLGVAVVVLLFCTVFFFILYALCLANIGLMQCLALGSLLVHGRFCYIQ